MRERSYPSTLHFLDNIHFRRGVTFITVALSFCGIDCLPFLPSSSHSCSLSTPLLRISGQFGRAVDPIAICWNWILILAEIYRWTIDCFAIISRNLFFLFACLYRLKYILLYIQWFIGLILW